MLPRANILYTALHLSGPAIWDFPKIRVPYFGVFIIRILLLRALY